jgi:YYY domain-containing protein
MTDATMPAERTQPRRMRAWVFDLILALVLLMAAYFRLVGINWGEYQYLHPDERFLVWVGSDITPLKCTDPAFTVDTCPEDKKTWMSFSEYFDSATSTLNPVNRGHGFYVYGTLPMFLTRFAVQWVYGHSGFNEMTDIGRPFSALADLLTVFLVFLIATRLYDRRVGLLAAAFSAVVVLQIQLSHFFTMDTFVSFFTYLAIYFAVRVSLEHWPRREAPQEITSPGAMESSPGRQLSVAEEPSTPPLDESVAQDDVSAKPVAEAEPSAETRQSFSLLLVEFARRPFFWLSIAFGVALGCAVASKLNAAPVAIMLPAALLLTFAPLSPTERRRWWVQAFCYLALGAVVSLLIFRVFQPYAFSGPGFFGIQPNPQWVANIREQRLQAAGDVDFPPALQWARRSHLFSGENLVLWGLGLPLGILAWAGFLWAGWRMLKGDWQRHALLWGWVGFYFIWQSLAFNPTMRYQLPIYPGLTIFAAWGVVHLYDIKKRRREQSVEPGSGEEREASRGNRWARLAAVLLGGAVLLATIGWAYAFTRIYVRPVTRVAAARWIYQNIPGAINLHIQMGDGMYNQPVPFPTGLTISAETPYATNFTARETGEISEVYLGHAVDESGDPNPKTLLVEVSLPGVEGSQGSITSEFKAGKDPRGDGYLVTLKEPVPVEADAQYALKISLVSGSGSIALSGAAPANESSWDDGLPLRLDGYDGYGGIYEPGLNFEMYWDDNAEKLQRFTSTLDQADYIFITSSRQWGSLPRVPERYPLTTVYYRELLGCPPERNIQWCYAVAQPGMFKGNLGYDLVKVFQSDPSIGPLDINDQLSEEAFTVYDHPKVLIFQKRADYSSQQVAQILGAVDLSKVIHVTPKRATTQPATLLLPEDRWAEEQAGGTWAQLFNTQALQNAYPYLGAVLWYISLFLLGLIAYPILRLALPGLADRGYPLARTAGLLLLSWLVWVAGSAHVPCSRLTIGVAIGLMVVVSLVLAYRQRDGLRQAWHSQRRYFLIVEGLFLAFFLFDLLIRFGNPDLWHPWKGGEKPMDFSYFNAVLKSTNFPPYDPWYAGGYLNYYYYGFLFVGVLVKFLGIVPSIAYNLALPTLFAMMALGAFSIGWNLMAHQSEEGKRNIWKFWVGLASALGMAVLGNLGTVRMIYQGYQRLAAPGGVIEGANILTRWLWALQGMGRALTGSSLPYGIGDWYWLPSRAIPAPGDVEPITEFPFFTVLYADLHAHLFALTISLLVIAWGLSVVLSRGWKENRTLLQVGAGFFLGALAIGVLYPMNLSDIYTYLPLGIVCLGYALWRYYDASRARWLPGLPETSRRLLVTAGAILLLVLLTNLLYRPYSSWYAQPYTKISLWKGTHTPLSAYLTHWGLFLFVIVSWMIWETRDWLASTPLSSVRKLEPYKGLIYAGIALILIVILGLLLLKVAIAWVVVPLAVWAGVLLLRPGLPDTKRFVLFLVGTGLVLTLMVEVIVVVGDIGRMNTVFKFYLQTWTLFAVSAGAGMGWVLMSIPGWNRGWRLAWEVAFTALVAGAALFTLMGGMAKVQDRMALEAPHTLDGMTYMEYAQYADTWGVMDLSQDYRAIRWMQENVKGSPVIVEANLRDLYRWGSRFSIYTGLPGVVGWEWHEQQQRALLPPNWVSDRIAEVDNFYTTVDLQQARDFLTKYNVRYIILGQQERGKYPGPGLDKFPAANGSLWQEVYRDGDTVIYEVNDVGGDN